RDLTATVRRQTSSLLCSSGAVTGYESFSDKRPETPTDTTPLISSSSFDDKTVRRGFVRKVFSIVTLQLVFTFTVVSLFTFCSVVKEAVQTNLPAYLSSFIIFIVVTIALTCCKSFSRRHPWNIVGLAVVTLSMSYMVGTIASFHNTTAVVVSVGATLAITITAVAFSAQTWFDLTVWNGVLLILAVDLLMFGIFCSLHSYYYTPITHIVYGCLGALLYSLFLMFHCQLMMGWMSDCQDPEEYITAALNIYLDVMLIFLFILGRR
ncbi:LOW QUALITY PROTEIN: protein lifeguard 1, partial [Thalassophryne amazonica]|uniref:LOW QUALITY PROTEIN: protein lifeguard 1 n=1 Tax=Thalassophryne amazonica TaxID=390379 RepID=UPI0014714138